MKKFLTLPLAALLCAPAAALAQKTNSREQQKTPAQTAWQQQRAAPPPTTGLTDYGIEIAPDPRLVVMMAALDAAGWDPTPAGASPSVFRELVRKDQAGLDPALRRRMQDFYEHHALKGAPDNPATAKNGAVHYTPAEQAARYVSLAYTLGPPPTFEAPQRSDDLPAGVLDVLDFVPILREFYKQSGIDTRLSAYIQMHRAEGDSMRAPTLDMARAVLAYLNTRPETTIVERIVATDPGKADKKKPQVQAIIPHERDRHFRIVPDLLAAPGAINFRAVGDDYYAIVPKDTDPRLSETRRAYVQFVIDPLVSRFSRDISARREDIKQLLEREHQRRGADLSPDIFLAVSRSLVAAADVRLDEYVRLRLLQIETSRRLQKATDQAAKDAALKESKERQAAIEDSATAQLADAYERGAVLAFYFAEQLRDTEGSGFDIANFITPMVAGFNVEREAKRPSEYADAVARFRESRRRALEASKSAATAPTDERRGALLKSLNDVEDLLRVKNYEEAETRLTALRGEYKDEPLVYFALGQAASLSAQEAFDETLQAERLNKALGHYRQAILFATASPDTDPTIVLRSHLASGRILAHMDRRDDAAREFDAVIAASKPEDRWYQEAVAEKKKLGGQ